VRKASARGGLLPGSTLSFSGRGCSRRGPGNLTKSVPLVNQWKGEVAPKEEVHKQKGGSLREKVSLRANSKKKEREERINHHIQTVKREELGEGTHGRAGARDKNWKEERESFGELRVHRGQRLEKVTRAEPQRRAIEETR